MVYRVLLVDDEVMITSGLKKIVDWQALGFQVVACQKNGQAALDYVKDHPVELVITDVTMPKMDGLTFLREARQLGQSFESIVLTGYQEFDYAVTALQQGAINYLTKPIDEQLLIEALAMAAQKIATKIRPRIPHEVAKDLMIQNWLQGEVTPEEIFQTFDIAPELLARSRFMVVLLDQEEKPGVLAEYQQKVYRYLKTEGSWQVVLMGTPQEIDAVLFRLKQQALVSGGQIFTGEIVTDYLALKHSLKKALAQKANHQFYAAGQSANEIENAGWKNQKVPEISFEKLGQALMIHDLRSVKKEVESILQRIRKKSLSPELARHFSFLIFIELYRNFSLDEELYQKTAQRIVQSRSFGELEEHLLTILAQIAAAHGNEGYSQRVQQIIEIIQNEYMHDITLKDVSERLFLNTVYTGQLFKKEVQQNFSQYLNHYRLAVAQRLLLTTGLSVSDVAVQSGYGTANNLYKNFKKLSGLSPKDFRKQYQKEEVS